MINYLKDFLAKNADKHYEITFYFVSGQNTIDTFEYEFSFKNENIMLCTKDGAISILNVNLIERIEFTRIN